MTRSPRWAARRGHGQGSGYGVPDNDDVEVAEDMDEASIERCGWASITRQMTSYHDREWGVPIHDDRHLFELLVLEGAQAGLSWSTILNKREGYREAFRGFEPATVARFSSEDIERILQAGQVVRNRAKIGSAVRNARVVLEIVEEWGSIDRYIWSFVGGLPIQNAWEDLRDVPAFTPQSAAMSKDLKKRGCSFVGPTICYAFMQSAGLVNDHLVTCFRHAEVSRL